MIPTVAPRLESWEAIRAAFRWQIPEHFNLAWACCDRHAGNPDALALVHVADDGSVEHWTFREMQQQANRLANALLALGLQPGDRVGLVLPQRPETGIAHMALYKIGAVALPLANLFGPEALKYRLSDSGARAVVYDVENREKLNEIAPDLPDLEFRIQVDDDVASTELGWADLLAKGSDAFETRKTLAEDPCWIIYTSGTTGNPKGALHAHRALIGHMPGWELSHDLGPKTGDLAWTPADWAWAGGLMDALVPSWFYGCPVLGYDGGRFDPERACWLLEKYRVRNAFIPPTALKMIRQLDHLDHFDLKLRSVMSAGETVGSQLYHWAEEELHVCINEMWGQTEFNYAVGNSSAMMPTVPGAMGKPYPGHQVVPLSESGEYLADGVVGELCAWRDDPVMFLGYWNRDAATREKFLGNWWRSGDMGYRDSDGYLWFVGRGDDVISSAGYRIGPGEIEDCLLKHSAVAQ
ncbi:MAG: AMP-binding protein, partial [Pseudomonadota bacterium]|nr:AMP-binding protein [Pseudomonadota bacterium]